MVGNRSLSSRKEAGEHTQDSKERTGEAAGGGKAAVSPARAAKPFLEHLGAVIF